MAALDEPAEAANRLINLIPVGLKEAALDSPTSRATIQHYSDQVELIEKWLDEYLKATNRLVTEQITLESITNIFTSCAVLPATISETMLDHDFSLLVMRKYAEGAKEFWSSIINVVKRLPTLVCEPIRQFQMNELKVFKETRRQIEMNQKTYDNLHAKFMGYGKFKEPSSLREEAFQLHEARRAYLRSCMDLFQTTPQFRFKLDKLLVRIFSDQWREMNQARESTAAVMSKNTPDMDRIKGWIREMENSESSFQRELAVARKQLEEEAELNYRPSRELDGYSVSTVPSVTGHTHTTSSTAATLIKSPTRRTFKTGERAGWLFLRTYSGKPSRVVWVKKWAFVRNGVFGWLVHDVKAGGVEESERIGVLLCAVRLAHQEERRFCFELKTNKNTIMLQAETQADLAAWIAAFEAAKTKAVNDPSSSDSLVASLNTPADPAFSISAPPVPEFGTSVLNTTEPFSDDRDNLPVAPLSANRESFDVSRRLTGVDELARDSASRIMSKLELNKRAPASPTVTGPGLPSGGIASLIAASHGSMPVGPSIPMVTRDSPMTSTSTFKLAIRDMPPSSLAPATLANVPTPTGLSKAAVAVSGQRGIRGNVTGKYGIPNGILANTWGSSNSSFVNRFDRSELRVVSDSRPTLQPSPMIGPTLTLKPSSAANRLMPNLESMTGMDLTLPQAYTRSRSSSPTKRHRNTISVEKFSRSDKDAGLPEYPPSYPLQLKTQDAQFRLLFPNVRKEERLTMVFRATWNPSGQQDFPGRAYVTTKEMYFYSNHFGLVLTSGISLSAVDEITAAPGKDCDFLFVHFKQVPLSGGPTRITIKIFLEPLKLTQRRLNYLVKNCQAEQPQQLDEVVKTLIRMESELPKRSSSLDSWEEVDTDASKDVRATSRPRASTTAGEFRAATRIDRGLFTSTADPQATVFKLPAQPVKYVPPGYRRLAVEREYDVSPKALFHVMFGDRSVLWQLLQHEHRARDVQQGPWKQLKNGSDDASRLYREFKFSVHHTKLFGQQRTVEVNDYQTIDVVNDHLCYVVTDRRVPWHLPFNDSYRLISKVVITHVAKTKCKLAIYVRVDWSKEPSFGVVKRSVESRALADLDLDVQDLADLVSDQVRRLGSFSRTKKAIQIFGQVGQAVEVTQTQIDTTALQIELRRVLREQTILTLLLQDSASLVQKMLTTVLDHAVTFTSWLHRTLSANTIILAVLAVSLLYNTWFNVRDGYQWYRERNTAQFLGRLGIRANNVMSRSIYIADIDEGMTANGLLPDRGSSPCYTVFQDEYILGDLDAPLPSLSSGSSASDLAVRAAKRLQRTRQRLGGYRHDLLVAMRVVNSIEREVISSAWEDWVVDERRRCRAIEPVIATNRTHIGGEEQGSTDPSLSRWYQEYCESCKTEYGRLSSSTR